tara:strand:- start:455 stop:820 length:366 start_codon:yes stop_codon:yes gene_type:complete
MADVTSLTSQLKGTRSCTAKATLSGGANDTITSAQLLAAAPSSGPIFDFLNATYANDAAAETAWVNAAGVVILRPETGAGVATLAWLWKATGPGKPTVQLVNAGSAGTFAVTLIALHSIIV